MESLDYIFRLAVEMRRLGLPWTDEEALIFPQVEGFKPVSTINGVVSQKRGRPKSTIDRYKYINGETPSKRPGRPRKNFGDDFTHDMINDSFKRRPGRPRTNFGDGFTHDMINDSFKRRPGRPRKSL